MMEFVATEAAFPVMPSHLITKSAYAELPSHPLGVLPFPAGAKGGSSFHLHSQHFNDDHHSVAQAHHSGDEEAEDEDQDAPENEEQELSGEEELEEEDDDEEVVEVDEECRKSGLGDFAELEDSTVYLILQQLPREDLLALSLVSRAFYAFAEDDQLWKNFILHRGVGHCDSEGDNFCFKGTWKRTVLMKKDRVVDRPYNPVSINGFYSDLLYGWWYYANVDPLQWARVHDEHEIDRRSGLSVQQFVEEYESKNRPVMLTDIVSSWPAATAWTKEKLLQSFGSAMFKTDSYNDDGEKITMSLANYFTYSAQIKDESSLYLFDSQFGEKVPALLEDYRVPDYFQEDFFSTLGNARPDYRWVIVGPPRSGSAFHQDPNRTAAWNALISGRKRWILFPPHVLPPGVEKDENGNTLPIADSVIGWYLNYYDELQEERAMGKVDFIECIQYPGELIFVPEGWWHMVLNMEETIAVTQNFVSSQNLFDVYAFLHDSAEMHYLLEPFVTSMRAQSPTHASRIDAVEQRFNSCTARHAAGPKEFVKGVPHFCLTCDPSRERVCCRACASKCHKDHDVQRCPQEARFYCDCGSGELLAKSGCLAL